MVKLRIKSIVLIAVLLFMLYISVELGLLCVSRNRHETFRNKLYRDVFVKPYWNQTIRPEHHLNPRLRAARGARQMSEKTMVFCGLARNVGVKLEMTMKRLEQQGEYFKDYRVVVFENDSCDDTRVRLLEWEKRNSHVHLIKLGMNPDPAKDCQFNLIPMYQTGFMSSTRMQKMASFRNRYLDYVREHLSHFDFMCVLDLDMRGGWAHEGFCSNFDDFDESQVWDMMCCHGLITIPVDPRAYHYDALALVLEDETPEDILARNDWAQTQLISYFFTSNSKIRDFVADNYGARMPIRSGCSGMVMYRVASLMDPRITYATDVKEEQSICEHIILHENMRRYGSDRMFLNTQHTLLAGQQGPSLIAIIRACDW